MEVYPQAGPVGCLPANVLDYWHRALIADDLGGLQATDVRIPLKNYARLAWPDFNLGFGTRPALALGILTERAAEARRKQQAQALEASEDDAEGEQEADEPDDDPRTPMALVFHQTTSSNDEVQVTWPDPDKKPAPGAKNPPQARPAEYRVLVSFRPERQKPNMPATRPQRLPAACGPPMA